MKQYLELMQYIMEHGTLKQNRTGIRTKSIFGHQMRFKLSEGFPLVTTKKTHMRSIIHELLWFLSGSTNIRYLVQNNVRIWNEWPYDAYKKSPDFKGESIDEFAQKISEDKGFADKWGGLGPVYGKQWRRWETSGGKTIDQIQYAIDEIKNNPDSRRILVSGWNVGELQGLISGTTTAPPLCHSLFQFYVNDNKLSLQLYQRSADLFLGVPFNIASYSLLLMMFCSVCGLEPDEFIHTFGDVHIYENHFEQAMLQLSRQPRKLPEMKINTEVKDIFSFSFEDFELIGYDPHPHIKAQVAL